MRSLSASVVFALLAVAVAGWSAVWAWATFDYWGFWPLVTTVGTTGVLIGSSVWTWRRSVVLTVVAGLLGASALLAVVFVITGDRWAR